MTREVFRIVLACAALALVGCVVGCKDGGSGSPAADAVDDIDDGGPDATGDVGADADDGGTDTVEDPGADTDDGGTDTTDDGADDTGVDTGGTVTEANPTRMRFAIPSDVATITVQAGVPFQQTHRVDIMELATFLHVAEGTIDVEETMASLVVVPAGGQKLDGSVIEADVRIAPGEMEGSVCSAGVGPGPVQVGLDGAGQPRGEVEPTTLEADEEIVDHVNAGDFSLCTTVSSPISATLTLEYLVVDYTLDQVCDRAPADIAGEWVGTYECENFCAGEPQDAEGGAITLWITQDDRVASYTDDEADYEGTVCGDTFSYSGGVVPQPDIGIDGYTESGQFVVSADGATATKTSNWRAGLCHGRCSDVLSRAAAP